ncbi:WD40/YVTN/BNR-like repeat-containing protein [Deinococcus daejeonensis]|nr:sialidase family protein [Deinococcus daejeonensis]
MSVPRAGAARTRRWWGAALTAAVGAGLLMAALGRGAPRPADAVLSGDFHALRALGDGILLYGQHAGVARSVDGGRTWGAPDGAGDAMALAAGQGGAIILAGHDVLKVSRDGGVTWQDQGFGNLPGTDLHGFATRPDQPGTWFANVAGRGLYRTADGGVTWAAVSPATQDAMTLAAAPGGRLYALSMSQGLMTSPTGVDWERVEGAPQAVSVDVHPVSGAVYVAGPGGVSRSLDGGLRWETLDFPEGARLVTADPQDEAALVGVGDSGRVYRSADAGRTWRPDH